MSPIVRNIICSILFVIVMVSLMLSLRAMPILFVDGMAVGMVITLVLMILCSKLGIRVV